MSNNNNRNKEKKEKKEKDISSTSTSTTTSKNDPNGERLGFDEPKSDLDAYRLENKHVHNVYNVISSHFDSTRYKAWPLVENYLNSITCGSIGVDVGCGNGKYLNVNKGNIYTIGSDICQSFSTICNEKGLEALSADGLYLPYQTDTFDYAISIAVIHHFSTFERRVEALKEIVRVLKPGGTFLVTAWAMSQKWKGKNYDSSDVMVPWLFQSKFKVEEEKKLKEKEEEEEISKSGTTYQQFHRYYHLFCDGEFESLFEKIQNVDILSNNLDHDNYYCIIKKK
ncbi:Hypothetical Generic methyl-transferase/SAM [Cavenderia fasciculata]|uniref:Hypothetical Generic methyl-transferase/SAM n=1 Tax=Cavenderia fasciculata TaxID=261658 RepID=F4Q6K7_CACFS|nr:putative Generic methyl-transferase/SAM [Cavenderia fasciculata]EGG16517.1 Hypothetical Generic methyl-transferase/SAM [Cavenderia fasciculata]|eukprot:XP_004354917.1 Hypothetical Generic methyl-transferase/SAM [Cavenderia fasciculata]